MATALLPDSRPLAALVRAMLTGGVPKGLGPWSQLTRVGKVAGLKGSALERVVVQGVAAGLIERSEARSVRVRASRLGQVVFGVATSEGPAVDASGLEGYPQGGLVAELARMPSACPLAEALAERIGMDVEDAWESLEAAEKDGLVELLPDWTAGPSVALTSLAAELLDLVLTKDGSRWIKPGDHDATTIEGADRALTESLLTVEGMSPYLDTLADPDAASPLDQVEAQESGDKQVERWLVEQSREMDRPKEMARVARAERGLAPAERARRVEERATLDYERVSLPFPTLILGCSLVWPAESDHDGSCPGCHGAVLSKRTACVMCDRSGLDGLISGLAVGRDRRSGR